MHDLHNPYRREFLISSLSIKTGDDNLFSMLAESYPEMLQGLFDAVGTVTARSHGMNIKSIFKKKAKKEKEQFRFVQLPDGTTAKIRNF